MMPAKLYGSEFSPFVRHCRIALIQSQLEWEFVVVDNEESAKASPSKKVPYFEHGGLFLTDSVSILRYLREHSGLLFMPEIRDFELFCMTNTALDATINCFLLEKDGIAAADSAYVSRQQARIRSALETLNELATERSPLTDGQLRLACFIEWAQFRDRFDVSAHDRLKALVDVANTVQGFAETSPYSV
ncbi:MAG: glutathione S-transferase [Pseudomonadota bacterium]